MKKLLYILLLLIPGGLFAQSTLNEYLSTAAENNPALKAQFNEYMAALQRVPQVGALPDPNIAFGYFIEPIETRLGPQQAKISANQMFPWFGTLGARENSAEAMAQAQYMRFEDAKSKLFYDVKSTYYNLYFTHEAIRITMNNMEILTSFRNLASIKSESASASALDIYRAEMEINDLENQLALLRDYSSVLSVKFNRLLNVDDHTSIQIELEPLNDTLLSKQALHDSIMANNKSLQSFDYQLESLQYKEQSARKEGMPQISLGLEYAFIGKGSSTMADAGKDAFVFPKVGLSIPLYRSKYKAKIEEVKYLQEAKSYEKTDKENTLSVLFENVWKDYSDARRRSVLYETQTELAQKSLAILESKYSTAHVDFEEILRMQRQLLKYELELQKAFTDTEAALAFINYLQGK